MASASSRARRRAAPAAGASALVRLRLGYDHTWHGRLEWCRGKVLRVLAGDGIEWKAEFTERRPWWPAAEQGAVVAVRARGRRVGAIYRRANAYFPKPSLQCRGTAAHRQARPWQGGTGRTGGPLVARPCGACGSNTWGADFKGLGKARDGAQTARQTRRRAISTSSV
jgi:hypothetical protein